MKKKISYEGSNVVFKEPLLKRIIYFLKEKRTQFKEWWSDLVAWWKSYRNKPTVTIVCTDIYSNVPNTPIFKARGRCILNVKVTNNITHDAMPIIESQKNDN